MKGNLIRNRNSGVTDIYTYQVYKAAAVKQMIANYSLRIGRLQEDYRCMNNLSSFLRFEQ